MKKFHNFLHLKVFVLLAVLLIGGTINGQSLANYSFSAAATGSLTDMSTGTTNLLTAATYHDDDASAVTNIGFPFVFMGTLYNQFSVNSNGQMRLGSSVINGTAYTTPTASVAILAPMAGDNAVKASGRVVYKVTGTAGNQVLIVSWEDITIPYSSINTGATMQARLYEANGKIEFVYGNMYNGTAATSRSIFLGSSNTATTNGYVTIGAPGSFTLSATNTANTFSTVGTITNLSNATDGSRVIYTWTPGAAPTAATNLTFSSVTGTSMTLNWTDSPNEISYGILRSTDGINYTLVTSLAANTVTYPATGLSFGTLYYWKVVALSEGAGSELAGSQATNSPSLCGDKTVGGGGSPDYATLTAAFADINTNGLACNVNLILQSGYSSAGETFPLVPPSVIAMGAYTLTIYPSVSGLAITSANTTGTINMNGSKNVFFDGRVGATGSTKDLVIANTNAGTSYAIQFINDANNNAFNYCKINSRNTSTSSGTIVFGTTTGANGNDNNTISNCDIYDGTSTPYVGIYAVGTTATTAQNNSNNTISNNNIYNFFNAGGTDYGMYIGSGNTDWTISGNSFYQTTTRTFTAGNSHYGMYVSNTGNNYSITGNYIGGSAPLCAGTAWTNAGAFANRFVAMYLSVGSTTATSVQNNTIANHVWTSTSGATTLPGIWGGIYLVSGNANIGTTTGNTIGSSTGTGSIQITTSTTGGISMAIGNTSAGTVAVSNNNIGSISVFGNVATVSHGFNAIWNTAAATSLIISANTIGSTSTANSINAATAATGTTGQVINAILNSGGATVLQITGNTIANIGNAYVPAAAYSTSSIIRGIYSSSGVNTILGNVIYNLSTAANATGTGANASVIGIAMTSTTAGQAVSQNTIYGLNSNNASGAVFVSGIHYAGPTTGTNLVNRNFIYGLSIVSTSASSDLRGINFASGLANVQNNMIRLGYNTSGASLATGIPITGIYDVASSANTGMYYNTVYIGGTGVSSLTGNTYAFRSDVTTNIRAYQNNIFVNARSNAASGGTHYAVRVGGSAPNPAGLTLNYNDYFVSGTGGAIGIFNAANCATLADWKTAVGVDANSLSADPGFIAPLALIPDLHINTAAMSMVESVGLAIAGINNDIDGNIRFGSGGYAGTGTAPDLGADEFEGIPAYTCTTPAPGNTVSTSPTICNGDGVILSMQNSTAGTGVGYQWQSSLDGITYSNIVGATATTYSVTPTSVTYYQCVVTCYNGPESTPSAPIQITYTNNILSTTPGTRCGTGSVSLGATGSAGTTINWYSALTGGSSLGSGTTFATPSIGSSTTYYAGAETVLVASSLVTLGSAATTTSATGNTPFSVGYEGSREQYLVKASELAALGIIAGDISSLAFNVSSAGAYAQTNFTIKIAHTANTTIGGSYGTPTGSFTTVYTNPSLATPSLGWNTYTFSTPFTWDGVSNILIDICHDNDVSASCSSCYGTNSAVYYSATSFNSCYGSYADNVQSCGVTAANTLSSTYYTYRPNMKFGGMKATICSSPRVAVLATVTPAPALTITGNQTLCSGTITSMSVTSTLADFDNYVWTPITDLFSDAACTTPYIAGSNASTVYVKPMTPGSVVYTCSADNASLCANTATTTLTVNPSPTAVAASASSTEICLGSSVNLTSIATSNITVNTTIVSPTGDGGFETGATFVANNWTSVNGSYNNWYVGTAAGVQGGSRAAFTGTSSSSFVGTGNASVNHFYRDIAIPAGSTNITLDFYMLMPIIDNNYDFLNVYTTTTAYTPVAGTLPTTGYTNVFTYTTPAIGSYSLKSVTLPNALAGTTVRIVFTYKSDGVSPYAAVAVDNISLKYNNQEVPAFAWTSAPAGFTSAVQNPTGVTPGATTQYIVTATNSNACSNSASVNVTVDLPSVAGTATADDNQICSGTGTNLILTGFSGSIQWQSSSDGSTWSNISGENASTLATGNLSASTYYQAAVSNGVCVAYSNSVLVSVDPVSVGGSANALVSTICSGTGTTINLTGQTGSIQWESSSDNITFAPLSGETSTALLTGNLVATTYYRANVTSGVCSSDISSTATVTIDPVSVGGTTLADSYEFCSGNGTNITLSGNVGAIQWQSSTDNITFADISGETNAVLATGILSSPLYYRAQVTSGVCSIAYSDTAYILVNPLPVVDFSGTIADQCIDNTTFTLTGATPVGGVYSGAGVVDDNFDASAAGAGSHTITYTYTNSTTGCFSSATNTIAVNALPVVTFTGSLADQCIDNTTYSLTGGTPIAGTYSGAGVTGDNFDASAAGSGDHTLTYTFTESTTGCVNSATNTIHVNDLPVVGFSSAFTDQCVDNTTYTLTEGTPAGGIYSGTGVTGDNFNASVTGAGAQAIIYFYTDPTTGCSNFDIGSINVNALPSVSFSSALADQCITSTTYLLSSGSPAGGTYSGSGVSGTNFDASLAGLGTTIITYDYTDPTTGCSSSATSPIIVNDIPTVTFTGTLADQCASNTSYTLSGGSPAGGTYSGAGVSGNNFDASVAGPGSHIITYTYFGGTGCSGSATNTIIVNAIPTVSFVGAMPDQCADNTSYTLSGGSPAGGSYSGTGVSGTNFNASLAGAGTHVITYSYTDMATGCSASANNSITVNALPVVSFTGAFTDQCIYNTTYTLNQGSPAGGTYSGAGVSGTNFDASTAGIGSHTITYTYTNSTTGCTNSDVQNITVSDIPVVTFAGSLANQCEYNTVLSLTGGSPAGGSYSGLGVSGSNFNASTAGNGTHTITYSYTSPTTGCSNSATNQVTVNPKPATPVITMDSTGGIVILTSNAASGNQWYDLSGIIGGAANSTYTVGSDGTYYTQVTVNGCVSDPSNQIVVDWLTSIGDVANVKFNFYPNPADFDITVEAPVTIIGYTIMDARGRVIANETTNSSKLIIATGSLSNGIYFLRLKTASGFVMESIQIQH